MSQLSPLENAANIAVAALGRLARIMPPAKINRLHRSVATILGRSNVTFTSIQITAIPQAMENGALLDIVNITVNIPVEESPFADVEILKGFLRDFIPIREDIVELQHRWRIVAATPQLMHYVIGEEIGDGGEEPSVPV